MASEFGADLEKMLADYREQLAKATETSRQVQELSATALSPRRHVSVTVGSQGELRRIEFPSDSYRELPPRELAELLVATADQARSDLRTQIMELVGPTLPGNLDVAKLLDGNLDPTATFSADPRPPGPRPAANRPRPRRPAPGAAS